MRNVAILSVLALFIFALVTPVTALTFKVIDSKTGDPIAGAEVTVRHLTWMPKAEHQILSEMSNQQGIASIHVPTGPQIGHTFYYSVDKESFLLMSGRGMPEEG